MTDWLDDATGDLLLTGDASNYDISTGGSTQQPERDLLLARKGDYRLNPDIGVGLQDFLNDENPDALYRSIRSQLAQDGMVVDSVHITQNKLHIDAHYTNS
jgi:hypothetical protein